MLAQRSSRRKVIGGAVAASIATHGLISLPGNAQDAPGGHVQAAVTAHAVATDAAVGILAAGGSAADAAFAVAAVLSVVEGWFSSVLGGGTWALYYDAAAGQVTSLDGVGPVGAKATREDFEERAGERGIHHANVPGAWDGWMLWLQRYGRLNLGDVLAPAITIAREGFEATDDLAYWADNLADDILDYDASRAIYAPEGEIPVAGDVIVMNDLAATFEALVGAYDGALGTSREAAVQAARDYYYRGPLAEAIVAYSDEHDGYLTLDDFQGFAAQVVDPISIEYRDGITVYQNPPNSQGITMLLGLNILKGMDLAQYDVDDPDAVHLQIEATKLAFADREAHIGDPARIEIPLAELLSDDYAARQRERIDLGSVLTWPVDDGLARRNAPAHTTTFQIVDSDGNAASVTTSLGAQFLVIPGTGIHINNRMRMLSVEPGNPNELVPGYKVRHTSCPYMALRDGRPYILGGNTGVDTQPQGQVQQFISAVEFGLSAQEAISRPRWVSTSFPSTQYPWEAENTLLMQRGFSPTVLSTLQVKGHKIVIGEGTFGSASMLIVDRDGANADVGAEPALPDSSGIVIPGGS